MQKSNKKIKPANKYYRVYLIKIIQAVLLLKIKKEQDFHLTPFNLCA
jgi:hypothetical protein